MPQEVVNIPRESTFKQLMLSQRISEEGAVDREYKAKVAAATSKDQVDGLFAEWWRMNYHPDLFTKAEMLERWFGNVLDDDRVHGVSFPLYDTSTSAIGELTDDSVGLVANPSTEETAGQDDFAKLPQFWCLEVSAEKKEDGSHEVFYVEHVDNLADVRSGEHLTWVLQKNTWTREYDAEGYRYLKMRCHPANGYEQWPEGTDKTGHTYTYMAHPKYPAGEIDGVITCGTRLAPVNWCSHTTGVSKWRSRGSQYSGASGTLAKFLMRMMWLKYAQKGNAGKITGCNQYNYQYTAAVSEVGVERVILTKTQAANLFVGSAVQIGVKTGDNMDRNSATNYSVCRNKLITKIEDFQVEDDETEYSAVYIDNGGVTFDTTAGATLISTDPYWSGWNDDVKGVDGSRYNPASGKEPGMIQKIEFMHGAYLILSDELWQWSTDDNGDYNFECHICKNQAEVASSITAAYEKQNDLTMVIPVGTSAGWKYIGDLAISKYPGVLWPSNIGASGSGVGCKAAFSCSPAASGVRAAWVFGNLNNGGNAGLACRNSNNSPGNANWNGAVGATGYYNECIIH